MDRPLYEWVVTVEAGRLFGVQEDIVPETALVVRCAAAIGNQGRLLVGWARLSESTAVRPETGPHSLELFAKGNGCWVATMRMVSCVKAQGVEGGRRCDQV